MFSVLISFVRQILHWPKLNLEPVISSGKAKEKKHQLNKWCHKKLLISILTNYYRRTESNIIYWFCGLSFTCGPRVQCTFTNCYRYIWCRIPQIRRVIWFDHSIFQSWKHNTCEKNYPCFKSIVKLQIAYLLL